MNKDMNDLVLKINDWFDERNLNDAMAQFTKLSEEVGEIARELIRGRTRSQEMQDALGDTFVVLVGMAHHLGLDFADCVDGAYQNIKDRKGKIINGCFVKDA